jgi:hypothetical protein
MKIQLLISYILAFLLATCSANKKVTPDFPEAMLPHVKAEYTKRFEKGRTLYEINCSKCHNTKSGRKEIVPDFSPQQLTGYTLRVSNAQHEKNMPDSLVTEEELGIIMTFLSYKKKNSN